MTGERRENEKEEMAIASKLLLFCVSRRPYIFAMEYKYSHTHYNKTMKMHERKQQNSAPIFYSEQWQNAFFQIVFRFVVLAVCANETMPVDLHPQESSNYTMCSVFVLNDGQKRKEEEEDSQEN